MGWQVQKWWHSKLTVLYYGMDPKDAMNMIFFLNLRGPLGDAFSGNPENWISDFEGFYPLYLKSGEFFQFQGCYIYSTSAKNLIWQPWRWKHQNNLKYVIKLYIICDLALYFMTEKSSNFNVWQNNKCYFQRARSIFLKFIFLSSFGSIS